MTTNHWGVVAAAIALAAGTAHAQPEPEAPTPAPEPERDPNRITPVETGIPGVVIDPERFLEEVIKAAPGLGSVARGTLRRARRKISIGPTAGVYGVGSPSPGEIDGAVTFGLGLETFKIPVLPSTQNLKALVIERAKVKFKQAVIDLALGRPVEEADWRRLAIQIWEEAVREILGMENIRSKTMERPRLTLALEGNYLVRSSTFVPRLRLGTGVWKLTFAASVSAAFLDDTLVFVGPEIVAHFLTSKGARASVVDVFVRGDFEVANRDAGNTDSITVGARYLLDVL